MAKKAHQFELPMPDLPSIYKKLKNIGTVNSQTGKGKPVTKIPGIVTKIPGIAEENSEQKHRKAESL